MKKIVVLVAGLLCAVATFAQTIAGDWQGTLNVGVQLPIVLHISQTNEGCTATMDSPAQRAFGIPASTVALDGKRFAFSIAQLGAAYEGAWTGDAIRGTFRQGGASFPLDFSRTAVASKPAARPQDPVEPYPYRSEEVTFVNKEAGITLAGTFTRPEQGGPFPAVVLVTGSGPQNRNEEVVGHRPFLVLADHLTRQGIAVLRYDDRGVGESGGVYKTAGLADFASDARAAVAYLRTRTEADARRIGIIGHSEGGTIAFLLAAEPDNGLGYIVSMAGMAIPGDSLMRMQRALIAEASGVPAAAVAQNEVLIGMVEELLNRHSEDFVKQQMERLMDEMLPDSLRNDARFRKAFRAGVEQLSSPELRSLMACDPGEALSEISCPVLALGGDKDLQVPASVNLDRVKSRVKGPVTTRVYPGVNHLFQHCQTGLPGEYATIDETLSAEVLHDIAAWIHRQSGR